MVSGPTLSARKVRFNQFASVVYQQEPYMTPRDFLFSVMLENVDRKITWGSVSLDCGISWDMVRVGLGVREGFGLVGLGLE